MTHPPERVRVTRTRTTGMPQRRPSLRREITTQSPLGAAYLDSLMRAQLRLTVTVGVVVASALGSLPLLFALLPSLRSLSVGGLPAPWILLGVVVYPAVVVVAHLYARAAERIERQFAEAVRDR
ncbi:hypothetical protein GCM10022199_06200 [Marihabitans asiaticum]|uniref:Uncharacterized protein n=1 Tax=Marihabitans asiaticum TaxID=415218 RepID=A0A560WDH1_9MICO|nr:hypothetical protein [Marihabitans asiaticum]TWD15723.1 hypothetical protein FB557_1245 [Marihabitans asiaticum]